MEGLQQAEQAFSQMLSGDADTQQQVDENEQTPPEEYGEVEEEGEAEEYEAEPTPEPQRYSVNVNGEPTEITLDEALAGYSRHADYTRKTQELAQQRQAFEQEQEQLRQERAMHQQALQQLQQVQTEEPEPDWNALYDQDPLEWMRQKELRRERREQQQQLQQQQQMLAQRQEQERQAQFQAQLQAEQQNLTKLIPEWSDPERMASEKNQIREYALSIGWTPQELSQVYDSRAVVTLRNGMLLANMQKTGQQKMAPGTPTIGAGASPQQARKVSNYTRAKQRLAKTGTMRDAQAVFKHMLNNEKKR